MPLYNYSWARNFECQVGRHYYHVKLGYWGRELQEASEVDQYKWVVSHIKSCEHKPNVRPAYARPPQVPDDFMASMFDGMESSLEILARRFNDDWFITNNI